MPSNPEDAKGLMLSCIADPDPCLFVECGRAYGMSAAVPIDCAPIPLGKARIVKEGSEIKIISYSEIVERARAAAATLEDDGISVELIDLRTVSPWDRGTVIASVRKTGRAIVAHEAVKQFGVGAEIAAVLQEELFGELKAPIRRLGAPYTSVPFSKKLEDDFLVQPSQIVDTARSSMKVINPMV